MLASTYAAIILMSTRAPAQETLLRLRPGPGSSFQYNLHIDRIDDKETGDLVSTYTVRKGAGTTIVLDVTLDRLLINGQDRTAEMKAHAPKLTAVLPWNDLSQRVGSMEGLKFDRSASQEIMRFCSEAGIYMGNFPQAAVSVGTEWDGETTATGGCTYCHFKCTGFSGARGALEKAYIQATKIRMNGSQQVGPMTQVIDVKKGIPLYVDYKARRNSNNKLIHFTQTLVWFKLGS